MASIAELDRRFYPGAVDEHVAFDGMIAARLGQRSTVLDAGAGRGLRFPYEHRRGVARLIGVDLDPAVRDNPNVDLAVVADLSALPFREETFDVVFSRFVFEHLARPRSVMHELRRVMRSGSHLLIHTPSRWHYVSLAARLLPTSIHVWYRRKLGWNGEDTFPTRYRANDASTLRRLASGSGFRVASIAQVEGKPAYLAWHPLAYLAGIAYERLVNRFELLATFRANLIVDLEASAVPRARP